MTPAADKARERRPDLFVIVDNHRPPARKATNGAEVFTTFWGARWSRLSAAHTGSETTNSLPASETGAGHTDMATMQFHYPAHHAEPGLPIRSRGLPAAGVIA